MVVRGVEWYLLPSDIDTNIISVYIQLMANPNPRFKLKSTSLEPLAESPIAVRLSVDLDKAVRSLPNRTEWLREAIAEKLERDKQKKDLST